MTICKIYDFEFVMYTHTQFTKACVTQKHWLIYNVVGNVNPQDLLPGMWFKWKNDLNRDEMKEL